MFSDATGQFEAVIFSDTLATARDLLEPGTPVLLSVAAERDGDTLKMRVESIASARQGGGRRAARPEDRARPARCIEKNSGAMAAIKSRLKPGGKGEIRLVLPLDDRGKELEFSVPGRYDVSPARAGMLATIPGVFEVLEI